MLRIRFAFSGRKNLRHRLIVVTESTRARDKKSLEKLGHYNPHTEINNFALNIERIVHHVQNGADISTAVLEFIRKKQKEKLIEVPEILVNILRKKLTKPFKKKTVAEKETKTLEKAPENKLKI